MILLTNLVQNRSQFLKREVLDEILRLIVSSCMSSVIKCYVKVPDMHPHRKQTVDLIRAIMKSPNYLNNQTIK